MNPRIKTTRIRTAIAGLSVALLAAAMLIGLPDGVALADTNQEKCASDGAVPDAANNPGLVSDCAALLDSKEILQGKGEDARKLNWSSSLPISQWDGIIVGVYTGGAYRSWYDPPRGVPNRVTKLSLPVWSGDRTKKLKGKIPKRLGDLSELRELNLFGNELHGRIRPHLGNLSELMVLILSVNNLSGKIPKKLGDLSELIALHLDANNLTGKIPKWVRRFSELKLLLLRYNNLTGDIPKELGELPKLKFLEIYHNNLSGCMPASVMAIDTRRTMVDADTGETYWLPVCN